MDFLHGFDRIVLITVLLIVGVHHVGHLAYSLLHWPKWLVRHYERHREAEISSILHHLGFDGNQRARARAFVMQEQMARVGRHSDYRARCEQLLKTAIIRGQAQVGRGYQVTIDYFIDVMSLSLTEGFPDSSAEILASLLNDLGGPCRQFDRIVGIKEGSPLLATKLGQRLKVEVALFRGRDEYKFNSSLQQVSTLFDGTLKQGESVLIVDDSVTGGRKVLDCSEMIRRSNCTVAGCLILFEVPGKNVRQKFQEAGVPLYSVLTLDKHTERRLLS